MVMTHRLRKACENRATTSVARAYSSRTSCDNLSACSTDQFVDIRIVASPGACDMRQLGEPCDSTRDNHATT